MLYNQRVQGGILQSERSLHFFIIDFSSKIVNRFTFFQAENASN